MTEFVDGIDLSASYTETAFDEVRRVKRWLPEQVTFYDYKDWLDEQAGMHIESFSQEIYSHIPCIIFVTRDWYERPSTRLEMKFLSRNDHLKLVVDYTRDFVDRSSDHGIENYVLAEFDRSGELSVESVLGFLGDLGYSQMRY